MQELRQPSQVNELRDRLNVGMMQARNALYIMDEDMEKAEKYLRNPRMQQDIYMEAMRQAARRLYG